MRVKILGMSILCLAALMAVSVGATEEPAVRSFDTPTPPAQMQPLFLDAQPLMSVAIPSRASSWQQFGGGEGSCYYGCVFSSTYCSPGYMRAQVSGPPSSAKLFNFECVSACYDVSVHLTGFATC